MKITNKFRFDRRKISQLAHFLIRNCGKHQLKIQKQQPRDVETKKIHMNGLNGAAKFMCGSDVK